MASPSPSTWAVALAAPGGCPWPGDDTAWASGGVRGGGVDGSPVVGEWCAEPDAAAVAWLRGAAIAWLGVSAFVLVLLHPALPLKLRAPYGRHGGTGAANVISRVCGVFVGDRTAWVLMEVPSPALLLYHYLTGGGVARAAALGAAGPLHLFAGLWLVHYFNRTFIYPFRMAPRPPGAGPTFNVVTLLAGIAFNTVNATLNGRYLFALSRPERDFPAATFWSSPWTWSSVALFGVGMFINTQADDILRKLRSTDPSKKNDDDGDARIMVEIGGSRYFVPVGGMFTYVSCANYLGELTEWLAFALLTWPAGGSLNLASWSFLAFTFANLVPRALVHHQWYHQKFGKAYPPARKAVIPFLI